MKEFYRKFIHPQLEFVEKVNFEKLKEDNKIPSRILKNSVEMVGYMSITSQPSTTISGKGMDGESHECKSENLYLFKNPDNPFKNSYLCKNDTWYFENLPLESKGKDYSPFFKNILNNETLLKDVSPTIENSSRVLEHTMGGSRYCFCDFCSYCTQIINSPEGILIKRTLNLAGGQYGIVFE